MFANISSSVYDKKLYTKNAKNNGRIGNDRGQFGDVLRYKT